MRPYARPATTGFSLLEMVVVVTIILVMASIGMASYRSAKRSILIDLESDKLVALLDTMRTASQSTPRCRGILFEKEKTPLRIEESYGQHTRACDESTRTATPVQWAADLEISELKEDESSADSLLFRFIPPQGRLSIIVPGHAQGAKKGEITIGFAGGIPQERTIVAESLSRKIEKIKL